jgi:hypothetical protein
MDALNYKDIKENIIYQESITAIIYLRIVNFTLPNIIISWVMELMKNIIQLKIDTNQWLRKTII